MRLAALPLSAGRLASRAALVGALILAGWVGGCVTTVAPVANPGEGGAPGPGPAAPNPNEVQSAERRARVRLELAALYFGRGQHSTALDELKLAQAASPDMPEVHGLRGLIYAALGDAVIAEQSYKRALELNPGDGETMHNYGWLQCQQRRYAEAEATFERAIQVPNYAGVQRTLLVRGVCQARNGLWADAERTLSRSYELDPSNAATAYNLSDVLLRRGELERARFYVRRINQVPEAVTAQSLWLAARIERRIGNVDGVQDFGRQLRERFPQSPETLQYERGRFDE